MESSDDFDPIVVGRHEPKSDVKDLDMSEYQTRCFSKSEWLSQVRRCNEELLKGGGGRCEEGCEQGCKCERGFCEKRQLRSEAAVPMLLMNYFVTLAYEEASVAMARELGLVKSNKDVKDFVSLYRIKDRKQIMKLIKSGNIQSAIRVINEVFGLDILQQEPSCTVDGGVNMDDADDSNNGSSQSDLHFKLLLLEIIEMIRTHNNNSQEGTVEADNEFILKLIQHAKQKLTIKATSNSKYMADLEIIITLLLFPISKDGENLPPLLKRYYSLNLRSKLASLVNKRLLKHIHLDVVKRPGDLKRFPDLLMAENDTFLNDKFLPSSGSIDNDLITPKLKSAFAENLTTSKLSKNVTTTIDPLNSILSNKNVWRDTVKHVREKESSTDSVKEKETSFDAADLQEYKYEANLVNLMKLWIWLENQLHMNDIGVPRVENDSTDFQLSWSQQ